VPPVVGVHAVGLGSDRRCRGRAAAEVSDRRHTRKMHIDLLCPECHEVLTCTSTRLYNAGREYPVWICSGCSTTWVWVDGAWIHQDY
jgi:hypothetical protein